MTRLRLLLAIGAASLAISGSHADEKFTFGSAQFADNGALPARYAGRGGPRNCDGGNVSPHLRWSNPPKGTLSYTIVITDLDGFGEPNGAGFIHWIAYAIPASTTSLGESEGNRPATKFVAGKNTLGTTTYAGPCPRVGKAGPHKYGISLTALSIDGRNLKPGLTIGELANATGQYYLGSAELTVYYPGAR